MMANYNYTGQYGTVVEFLKSDADFVAFARTCQAFLASNEFRKRVLEKR